MASVRRGKKWSIAAVLLTGTALILALVVAAFSLTYYVFSRQLIQDSYIDGYGRMFAQLNRQLASSVDYMTQLAAALNNNAELIGEVNLARTASSASERALHERRAKAILDTAVGYQHHIANVGVYLADVYITMFDVESEGFLTAIPQEEWFLRILRGEDAEVLLPSYELRKNAFSSYDRSYCIYARAYNDTRISRDRGVLVLSFEQAYLADTLSQTRDADGSIVALLDEGNSVILTAGGADASQLEQIVGSALSMRTGEMLRADGENYFVIRQNNEDIPWELVALILEDVMYADLARLQTQVLCMALIALLAGLALILVFSRAFTRPFRALSAAMASSGDGELRLSEVNSPIREVHALAAQYDDMIGQISSLIEHNRQIEAQRRAAEMDALRSEINPHFLYNTLDSIRWMALMQKAPRVAEMISSLVRLLKLTTGQRGTCIRVGEEFEHVALYAEIIRFRYNCRIDLELSIDEGLENARTLGLLLQPIVENSFVHGFCNFERPGVIRVSASAKDGALVFTVEDNGCGVTLEDGALPEPPRRDGAHLHAGIGISNVQSRLRLTFGETYGVQFRSRAGQGTVVTLTQPLSFFEEGGES